jgi:hypothetical protein
MKTIKRMTIIIGELGDSGSFTGVEYEVNVLKWKADEKKVLFQINKDGVNYYGVAKNTAPHTWRAERVASSDISIEQAKQQLDF